MGHWKFDEDRRGEVDDDSGNELHGHFTSTPRGGAYHVGRGKFTRSLHFNGTGGMVNIAHKPGLNFGRKSFSFAGWTKVEDFTYPMTSLAVKQGDGCFYEPNSTVATPGWDIGHGLNKDMTGFCIRDDQKRIARYRYIQHDKEFSHAKLLNKWTHYVIVFDRHAGKVFLYINGKRKKDFGDISHVTGSIDNDKPLTFGFLYHWRLKGFIDEYRLYKGALRDNHVTLIFENHNI